MDAADFAAAITFRIMKPGVPAPQGLSELGTMFERAGLPLDVMNTVLPETDDALRRITTELSTLPGRSTFATCAVIHKCAQEGATLGSTVCWGATMAFAHMTLHGHLEHPSLWLDNSGGALETHRAMQRVRAPAAIAATLDQWLKDASPAQSIGTLAIGSALGNSEPSLLDSIVAATKKIPKGGWLVMESGNMPSRREIAETLVARKWFNLRFDGQTTAADHPTWGHGLLLLQRSGVQSL